MIKIAEQKALEAYPILFSERNGYDNTFKDRRESYIKGYEQAMQDFLEKASKYLFDNLPHTWDITQTVSFIDNFKIYMQDEM